MDDSDTQRGQVPAGWAHEQETAFGHACIDDYRAGLPPRDDRAQEYYTRFRDIEARYAEQPPIQLASNHWHLAVDAGAQTEPRHASPLTDATLEAVAFDIQDAVLAASHGIRAAWPAAHAVEYSVNIWMPWMPLSFDSVADGTGAVLAWQSECEDFEDDPAAAQVPGLVHLCRLRDALGLWRTIPGLLLPEDATWSVRDVEQRHGRLAVRSLVHVELPHPDQGSTVPEDDGHGGCFEPHRGPEGYIDCDGRPL